MANDRIGFIGLGHMGGSIAERFLAAGVLKAVCDVNPANTKLFADKGVNVVSTPRDVADNADIVFACLPSTKICEEVALGKDGVRHGRAVKVYVDTSTIGIKVARELAAAMPASIGFIDSPVSGGPPGARAGTLTTMTSGKREHFDRVFEALSIMAKKVFYIGNEAGMAQTAKLINNHLSCAGRLAAFEGLVMAMKAGLDLNVLLDLINVSSGRNFTTTDKIRAGVLSGSFKFNGLLTNSLKDEALLIDEANDLGVPLWLAPHMLDTIKEAAANGYKEKDSMEVIQFMGERAGIDVKDIVKKRYQDKP